MTDAGGAVLVEKCFGCAAPLVLLDWGPLRVTDDSLCLFVFLSFLVLLGWLAFFVLDHTDGVPDDD